jgi:tetratricopeptide (TPR) repeat protein
MKKTTITFLISGLLLISGLKAQTVQEGKNHLFAQRYNIAIANFDKLIAANPNNIEAIYWLGQTYMESDEIMSARIAKTRQLYEKAMQTTNGAPLIMVGMGQVELNENKFSDARQKFETALTMTRTKKGDDLNILNAVGRANIQPKTGDFKYAIDKLQASVDKGEKNEETFVLLGDAYRKAGQGTGGSEAFKIYKKALEINPNFSYANLRLAKLFESQKNWELVLQYLNDATKKDPKYSAAYYELFYYYFYRLDFNTAETHLQKFIESKLPEKDIQDEYLYAQLCWARKDFTCAVTRAESVAKVMGNLTKPKVYRLLADANFQKGDYVNAKRYSDDFFAKKNPDDITSYDYKLKADILGKTGGTPDEIYTTYMQGAVLDTVLTSKIDFLKQGAEALKASGDRIKEADLRIEILKLKTNPGQRDIFDAGFAYYQGKNYTKADSLFDIYTLRFPEESFGWQMQYNIHRSLDSTMEKGEAIPYAVKYLTILEKDTAKNKSSIMGVAGYLAQYYANVAKDKVKAIEYLKKMLALDPSNTDIQKNISILEKSPAPKTQVPPKVKTPPAKTSKPKPTAVKSKTVAKAIVKN